MPRVQGAGCSRTRNHMDHKNAVPALSSVVLQNTISLASGFGRLSRADDEHGLTDHAFRRGETSASLVALHVRIRRMPMPNFIDRVGTRGEAS